MIYRVHLNKHVGRGETVLLALGELMGVVQKGGSEKEAKSLALSIMQIQELGVRLEADYDLSTGLPQERN